jgi:hypothetical protein
MKMWLRTALAGVSVAVSRRRWAALAATWFLSRVIVVFFERRARWAQPVGLHI